MQSEDRLKPTTGVIKKKSLERTTGKGYQNGPSLINSFASLVR